MTTEATTPGGAKERGVAPILEMRGITKRFPGVVANDRVDFDVRAGEVHSVFGENGAGKSTLMRILYGLYRPDEGQILINGEPVVIASPADAIRRGIGMIHQHFMLVNTLTVAENVALGLRSTREPMTDIGRVATRVRELAEAYGLKVDPNALVWQLSVGERQRVEIVKALYRNVALLVLDEPTAVLTPREVIDLLAILRQMADDGKGLVFISHKVQEVLGLSDRITVLRNGRCVGTMPAAEATRGRLIEMMVGHALGPEQLPADVVGVDAIAERAEPAGHPPAAGPEAAARLQVRGLRVKGDRGSETVRGVTLDVLPGEIVGIAGVSGNGQRELAEAIAGLRRPAGGSIVLERTELAGGSPARSRSAGLGYVPEERMRDGVIADFSVAENLLLVDSESPSFARLGFLRARAIRRHCAELISAFDVKTPGLDTPARNLSGGNIQKLIMARELSRQPRTLLVAQPTRGIDVSAAQYIHGRLREQRERGTAVLVISEDLDELMSLTDRVLVMYEGAIIGAVDPRASTREEIGLMMAGVRPDVAAAEPRPGLSAGP